MNTRSVTEFLNVDLDLRAQDGLEELLEYLEPSCLVLHRSEQFASVELAGENKPLEDTVLEIIKTIQSLPPKAKKIWARCDARIFNIGIQSAGEPHAAYFGLSNKAVTLLASIHGEILLTVYSPPNDQVASILRPRDKKSPLQNRRGSRNVRKSGLANRPKPSK